VVTRTGIPRMLVAAGATVLLGWALAGCGGDVEETIQGLSGGTNSGDKTEIPPQVQAGSATAPAGELAGAEGTSPTALTEPVAASKGSVTVASSAQDSGESKHIRESQIVYRAQGARDPFVSLVSSAESQSGLVDLSVVQLVAVVMGENEPFCVVEDAEGSSYVLRKGDRIKNGRVVGIRSNALVASQSILGYTTTVQLELADRKVG
jgi:hypothetical protein